MNNIMICAKQYRSDVNPSIILIVKPVCMECVKVRLNLRDGMGHFYAFWIRKTNGFANYLFVATFSYLLRIIRNCVRKAEYQWI